MLWKQCTIHRHTHLTPVIVTVIRSRCGQQTRRAGIRAAIDVMPGQLVQTGGADDEYAAVECGRL